MYIIKSGDLVWRRNTAGADGKFVNDATLFRATIMTQEKAQTIIADNWGGLLAHPPQFPQYMADYQQALAVWQAARIVQVRITECVDDHPI